MQQQQQPPTREPFDVLCDIGPGLIRFFVRMWGTAVEVFVRKDFGSEYLGAHAAAALLFIPIYAFAGVPKHDPRPMLVYWLLFLVMCFLHRVSVIRRTWRGERGHRYYNGFPRLGGCFLKLSEETVKKVLEPLFVIGMGLILLALVPPLGLFLVIGGSCSAFTQWDWDLRMRRRAREMHEAMLEQEVVAERFRDLRRDQYR